MPCVRRKIAPGRAASPIFLGKRETMGESLRAAKFAPYPVGADYISARGHYRRRNPARAHMQCAPTGAPQCPAPTGVYAEHAEHLTYGTFSIIYIIYYIFIYMYCTYVLKMASNIYYILYIYIYVLYLCTQNGFKALEILGFSEYKGGGFWRTPDVSRSHAP